MGILCPRNIKNEADMKKIAKVLVLVLMLIVLLPISPAQACACGVPDWSTMSDQEIVSTINGAEDVPRIMAGQAGELPPAPAGDRYTEDYRLIPL
jgi:hypothetical protein